MKPWPHTTITFVTGERPGHVTRDVLVNGSPVAVEEGGVGISQPASDDLQSVTLTLLPDAIYFVGPDGGAPASTEMAPADRLRAAATRLREESASPLALALADWLDEALDGWDAEWPEEFTALAVADAVLGGEER